MDGPKYQDEAVVVLSVTKDMSTQPDSSAGIHPQRRVLLSKLNPMARIGRHSRRKPELEAAPDNFLFDCPVMSRDHAMILLDAENRKVCIKDSSSLHGTCVNKVPLGRSQRQQIHTGDILTFGMTIDRPTKDRGLIQYHPFQVEANVVFGTELPNSTIVTYKVPDESEMEDISSDGEAEMEDHREMDYAGRVLKENGIRVAREWRRPIDLTSEDGELEAAMVMDRRELVEDADELVAPTFSGTQRQFVDLTRSFADPTSENQDEPPFPSSATVEIPDHIINTIDPTTIEEDEEDDLDWEEEESLPDVSVSCPSSDASDIKEEHGFPPSENTTHGMQVELDDPILDSTESDRPPDAQISLPGSLDSGDVTDHIEISPAANDKQEADRVRDLLAEKAEFFHAREENKRRFAEMQDSGEEKTQRHAEKEDRQPCYRGSFDELFNLARNESSFSAEVPLAESGLRFLNTPPEPELATAVPVDEAAVYDETSAFCFEMSKKAAKSHSVQLTNGTAETTTEVAPSAQDSQDEGPLSSCNVIPSQAPTRKRKIAEISEVGTEEQQATSAQESDQNQEPAPSHVSPPSAVDVDAIISHVLEASGNAANAAAAAQNYQSITQMQMQTANRPIKRLRRAAEVFGYVALGGVAAISALIATAPAL